MVRAAALLLTVLTGFSGLVYEVTWQKCLATLLGSHSEATSAVLGLFLGGLSVGYAVFGGVVRRRVARAATAGAPPRLLVLYGAVEAGIGLWALAFPWLFAAVETVSLQLGVQQDLVAFALDVALCALLVGPPAVLMGGTIPILTQALANDIEDATRFHAFVYGFNTVGAFAGALAAGFVLLPALGIYTTLACMGAVNIAAGASFAWLGHRTESAGSSPAEPPGAGLPAGFGLYAGAACLLGFAMMSVQTVLIRIGGLSLGASHFTFATVVAVFVLCIALGSLAVSALSSIPRAAVVACPALLAALLVALHFALPEAPYGAHVLRTLFSDEGAAFHPYYLAVFLSVLVVLAVPVGLSGASLPLLFHALRREVGDLGSVAGRLYSWNTIGNLLGALLGGYALLFWLDLHHIYRLGIGAAVGATLLLAVRTLGVSRAAAALVALPLGYGLVALPAWPAERMSAGLFRNRRPLPATYEGPDAFFRKSWRRDYVFYTDDPTSSVAVRERTLAGRKDRSIITNGKSDGSLVADYPTMALVALLPCALTQQDCESGFVIGYGTGVTVGELAALESVTRVDVAEISSGVLEAAPLFDYGNLGVTRRDDVHLIRSDAYRALLRSDTRYDVIASEPSNPWVTGVEMLFSREFLEAARSRLAPGGIYAQWFHVYETDTATMQLVLRTYVDVFDHVAVWYAIGHDLLLLGFADEPNLDLDRVAARSKQPDFVAGLRRGGVNDLPALLAHELLPLGVVHAAALGDEVHTLFHPRLSDRAARAFFSGRSGRLPFTGTAEPARRDASLWRTWLTRENGAPPDEELASAANQLCRYRPHECAAFLAWWRQRGGDPEEQRVRFSQHPDFAPHLTDARLSELEELFEVPDRGTTQADDVRRAAELYEEYYFHGTPFSEDALRARARRCAGAGCAAARAAVATLLEG